MVLDELDTIELTITLTRDALQEPSFRANYQKSQFTEEARIAYSFKTGDCDD